MKKTLKGLLIIILILVAGFTAWDQYMKATWDNHIVSEVPHSFLLRALDTSDDYEIRGTLSPERVVNLPEKYKKKFEILKDGDAYTLVSHDNQILTKTVRVTNYLKEGWLVEGRDDDRIYIDMKTKDGTIKVTMAVNQCKPYVGHSSLDSKVRVKGNALIQYTKDSGDKIVAYTNAPIYGNLVQYHLCD
jgi:hypothetical protein